jgi:hypothetical protein
MHRWATAPFCDVRNFEYETLKRGNDLFTQVGEKK